MIQERTRELHEFEEGLLGCPECDLLQRAPAESCQGKVCCVRCNHLLYRTTPIALDRVLALALTAVQLLLIVNTFPMISMSIQGETRATTLLGSVEIFHSQNLDVLAILVLLTTIAMPSLEVASVVFLVYALKYRIRGKLFAQVFRLASFFHEWAMIDVLVLAALVTIVKLAALANIEVGLAFWAALALLIVMASIDSLFRTNDIWHMRRQVFN